MHIFYIELPIFISSNNYKLNEIKFGIKIYICAILIQTNMHALYIKLCTSNYRYFYHNFVLFSSWTSLFSIRNNFSLLKFFHFSRYFIAFQSWFLWKLIWTIIDYNTDLLLSTLIRLYLTSFVLAYSVAGVPLQIRSLSIRRRSSRCVP